MAAERHNPSLSRLEERLGSACVGESYRVEYPPLGEITGVPDLNSRMIQLFSPIFVVGLNAQFRSVSHVLEHAVEDKTVQIHKKSQVRHYTALRKNPWKKGEDVFRRDPPDGYSNNGLRLIIWHRKANIITTTRVRINPQLVHSDGPTRLEYALDKRWIFPTSEELAVAISSVGARPSYGKPDRYQVWVPGTEKYDKRKEDRRAVVEYILSMRRDWFEASLSDWLELLAIKGTHLEIWKPCGDREGPEMKMFGAQFTDTSILELLRLERPQ